LKAAFGKKDMRQIDVGDIQCFVAASVAEGLEPKTVRNLWGTVNLIWSAALAQKYVDAMLPKPKLPRRAKKRAKFFTLSNVAEIITASQGEDRVFYRLAKTRVRRRIALYGLSASLLNSSRYCGSKSHGSGRRNTNTCSRLLLEAR
jgi:hypothetical protein